MDSWVVSGRESKGECLEELESESESVGVMQLWMRKIEEGLESESRKSRMRSKW